MFNEEYDIIVVGAGHAGSEAAAAAGILGATFFCFHSEPELPPSPAEAARRAAPASAPGAQTARLWADAGALLADRQYLLLLVVFGSGLGMMNSVLTIIETWVGTAGYGADSAGTFGAAFIAGWLAAAAGAAAAAWSARARASTAFTRRLRRSRPTYPTRPTTISSTLALRPLASFGNTPSI